MLEALKLARHPLSLRILSHKVLGGKDRNLRGCRAAVDRLIGRGEVEAVFVMKNHQQFEHFVLKVKTMAEYKIEARAPGTTADCIIITDEPGRAIRFTKLLSASGKWTMVKLKVENKEYSPETLDQLL